MPQDWNSLKQLKTLDLSSNVQMCGILPAFTPYISIEAQQTQLGQECPKPTLSSSAVAEVAGITVGACAGCVLAVAGMMTFFRKMQQRQADTRGPPAPQPGSPAPNPSLYMNANLR